MNPHTTGDDGADGMIVIHALVGHPESFRCAYYYEGALRVHDTFGPVPWLMGSR